MNRRIVHLLVVLGCTLGLLVVVLEPFAELKAQPPAAPLKDQKTSLAASARWLVVENQNPDGGFGLDFASGEPLSNVSATLDGIIALAAAGYGPAAVESGNGTTPLDFLESNTADLSDFALRNGGSAGKVVLSLVASARDPRSFSGQDWVLKLSDHYSPTNGQLDSNAFGQSLALLALVSVDESVPPASLDWLRDEQDDNGSWDDGFGTEHNPDATAMVVMALLSSGVPVEDSMIADAVAFFAASQLPTGGWEYGEGFGENANSTALVVQALSAAGEAFYDSGGNWAKGGISPLEVLLSWQGPNGSFQADFGQGLQDNYFATVQAIPAVSGRPFPLPGRYESMRRGLLCLQALQDQDTGGWEQFAGVGVNAGGTARAIQAIANAGENAQDARWTPGSVNAVEALENLTPDYLTGGRGGRVGIVMQGVVAAGVPYEASDFAGSNLPLLASSFLSPTGEYDDTQFGTLAHSEAMLGLLDADAAVDESAVDFLLNRAVDGDWGDPDSNGIALHVLSRLNQRSPQTIAVLHSTRTSDGGWGFGGTSNATSSSEVVQGLVSAGQNPYAPAWTQIVDGVAGHAADVLMQQQQTNGCWANSFAPGDDPFSTTDAVMLLAQEPGASFTRIRMPLVMAP